MKRAACLIALLGFFAAPAHAASLAGVWLTPPDGKAQTGHVQITPCGASLCGTVISAFDKTGKPIVTPSVGRRILWDVNGNGAGKVYVPIMKAEYPVQLTTRGNSLNLRACNKLGLCQTQVWQRVK